MYIFRDLNVVYTSSRNEIFDILNYRMSSKNINTVKVIFCVLYERSGVCTQVYLDLSKKLEKSTKFY